MGNSTVALAALLIALSNGWTLSELNPFKGSPEAAGPQPSDPTPAPLVVQPMQAGPLVAAELIGFTMLASYMIKYGETALGLPFSPNVIVAWFMVLSIPASVGYNLATAAPKESRAASE
jgi:hypothetical protein